MTKATKQDKKKNEMPKKANKLVQLHHFGANFHACIGPYLLHHGMEIMSNSPDSYEEKE